MKSNQTLRSDVQTCLLVRLFANTVWPRKAAAVMMAAALLLGFSAPAATVVWNWAGGDRLWSTAGNWSGGIPEAANSIIFNNTDAQTDTTTVNTVDASTTVSSLSYTNSSIGGYSSYQNTAVASGHTLTITNGLVVGAGSVQGATGDLYTYASLTGASGTVVINGGNVQIGHQSLGSGATYYIMALWDLRDLDSLTYNNAAGTFSVAGNAQRRQGGEVYLAATNNITASAISVGITATGVGSRPGLLHLGSTNTLFADTITVGQRQTGCFVDFQTGLADPIVKIRARDGISAVPNWYVGWHSNPNQNGNNASGTGNFTGGILNATVTNLYVGYMNGVAPTSTRTASGTFTMGTNQNNSLVVQNLNVGVNSAASGGSGSSSSSTGNFVVGGGTVTAAEVTLAQAGSYVANGSLTLSNGASMNVSGDLVEGGGTSTITVSSATLIVAGRIGAPTPTENNVETLNLDTATLGLTLIAPGDSANAAASVGTLNIDGAAGSTVLKINNAGPSPGQYPLIGYTSLGGAAGFDGLSVQAPTGYTATLTNNTATYPYTIDVILGANQLTWNGVPNGDWDIGLTGNWKSSATYTESGGVGRLVLFNDTASGTTTVNLTTTLSPLGITVNNTNLNYTFGGNGKLSGAGGLNKQGPGTLTLVQTGVNDYAGTTGVGAGGKLAVGNGGTAGNIGLGAVTVDGTLEVNRSDNVTLSNSISGLGGLNKPGANTLTLAGAVNLAGSSTISGGTLAMTPAETDTLAGNVTGAGGLTVDGAGTVVLSGSGNTYSGGTLISAGTLQIGDGVNAGSLPGNVSNQGSLVFNGSYYNLVNNISGSGSVMSIGPTGFLTLAGANTYTGPTTIRNGGTLILGSSSSFPAQSVLVLGEPSGPTIGSADFTGYNVVIGGLTAGGNNTSANTITLGSGQSLNVNGNVLVGNTLGTSQKANLTVTGYGASLTVNTNGGLIQLGNSASGNGTGPNVVNCDLTTLDVFTANLGSTGSLLVGELNPNTGNAPNNLQVLRLAATNTITAGTIGIGNGGKSIKPELHLGSGINVLNAGLIRVGAGESGGRDSGRLVFETGTGTVQIRGSAGGSSRANLNILAGTTGAGGTSDSTNTFDVAGHYADLLIDSLVMGDQANRFSDWDNYFGFDQGILDANNVSLSPACRTGTVGISLMHLGGGTVNFGSLAMASSSAAATLDITGGQVTVTSDITKTGTGAGTIQVANAALIVKGRIAAQASPMDVLSLDNGTLSLGRLAGYGNPTSALAAAGSLNLSGTCTIALTGTNYVVGTFPLIRYAGTIGGSGFAALAPLVPPPGVSATLVDNAANQTIDVNITAAPPLGPKASLSVVPGVGSVGLSWADLGMILQTNAVSVASPADWHAYPGSTAVTNLTVTIDPAQTNVFFRLLYP